MEQVRDDLELLHRTLLDDCSPPLYAKMRDRKDIHFRLFSLKADGPLPALPLLKRAQDDLERFENALKQTLRTLEQVNVNDLPPKYETLSYVTPQGQEVPPAQEASTSRPGPPKPCYRCGSHNHWHRECPNKPHIPYRPRLAHRLGRSIHGRPT